MTDLREPDLGPIVGHTTGTTCRIWIRGGDPEDRGVILPPNRRTVGVIARTEVNGKAIKTPDVFYFRLHRKYDRTGTFAAENNRPGKLSFILGSRTWGQVAQFTRDGAALITKLEYLCDLTPCILTLYYQWLVMVQGPVRTGVPG